ncbi:MAG: heterodisulfide reductase-related iron-sulfur binding cluster, partial [Candidatus Thermoplasmatota archaeon]
HDSCRLGRMMGIYEEPRALLKKVKGISIFELEKNKENSLCCGACAFMNCKLTEKMRIETLEDAKRKGDYLLVSCPKCLAHYNCTKTKKGYDIEIMPLVVFLDKCMVD